MDQSLSINGIRLDADGVYISLRCGVCHSVFEQYLTTVGGVPIGQYGCSRCDTSLVVEPEEYLKIVDRMFPVLSMDDRIALTEESTRITESWYKVDQVAELLHHKGINLGEGPERELMAVVLEGLLNTRNAQGQKK